MGHLTYEESKKLVVKGLWLLAIITLCEVFVSLFAKGYIWAGVENLQGLGLKAIMFFIGVLLIGLSLYKAYFIVYEFMHMRYEVKSLAMSVLLPTLLLVWAIIAFFNEGESWKNRREQIKEKNELPAEDNKGPQGMLPDDTYRLHL